MAKAKAADPPHAKVGRPHVPPMYGLKKDKKYLPWSHAEERLAKSRNYWICKARHDGRPHSIPVWGLWLEGALYFGTARASRKAGNLAHKPAVSVHLESGDDVVILEGGGRSQRPVNVQEAGCGLAREVQDASPSRAGERD